MSNHILRKIKSMYPAEKGFRALIASRSPVNVGRWSVPRNYIEAPVEYWAIVSYHTEEGRSDDVVKPFIRLGPKLEDASRVDGLVAILRPNERAKDYASEIEQKIKEIEQKIKEMSMPKMSSVRKEMLN